MEQLWLIAWPLVAIGIMLLPVLVALWLYWVAAWLWPLDRPARLAPLGRRLARAVGRLLPPGL